MTTRRNIIKAAIGAAVAALLPWKRSNGKLASVANPLDCESIIVRDGETVTLEAKQYGTVTVDGGRLRIEYGTRINTLNLIRGIVQSKDCCTWLPPGTDRVKFYPSGSNLLTDYQVIATYS